MQAFAAPFRNMSAAFADPIESDLSIWREGDLKKLHMMLGNLANPQLDSSQIDSTVNTESDNSIDSILRLLLKYMTKVKATATDLTTPPYYMHVTPGRRYDDIEKQVLCYKLARKLTDSETQSDLSSDTDVILGRMRTYVAHALIDGSNPGFDMNTCGEISLNEALNNLDSFRPPFTTEELPSHIIADIKTEIVRLFLTNNGYFKKTDKEGETFLMTATKKHTFDIQIVFDLAKQIGVRLLLDEKDSNGQTCLIQAAEGYRIEKLKLLIENGASVNAQDNRGFTALHSIIYDRPTYKVKFQTLLDRLCAKELKSKQDILLSDNENEYIFKDEYIKYVQDTKHTIIEIVLNSGRADVNIVDFMGKTPLDLALESRTMISKRTIELLERNGAVSMKTPTGQAEGDVYKYCDAENEGRGHTALHRLVIEQLSENQYGEITLSRSQDLLEKESYDKMSEGVGSRREKFEILSQIVDKKGRTALHYAVMLLVAGDEYALNLTKLLFRLKLSLAETDDNGQTPLHFASDPRVYGVFAKIEANSEKAFDKWGHTPKSLHRVRLANLETRLTLFEMPFISANIIIGENSKSLSSNTCTSGDRRETEHLAANTMATVSGPKERDQSALKETMIWRIHKTIESSRSGSVCRLKELNIRLQNLMTRVADAIGRKDSRFTCESILVGSSEDGTKIDYPGDFDFDLTLTKLSGYCVAVPSITTSSGYVHLKRTEDSWNAADFETSKFNELFNDEQLMLTNKVNCMFKFLLQQVLDDSKFWKSEDLFEVDVINKPRNIYEISDSLHSKVRLRMLHPIGDQVFLDTILLDIVPSICAQSEWIDETLEYNVHGKKNDCAYNFIFDSPQRFCPWVPFEDTFARVSFGAAESSIVKNCPSILKSAYVVVRTIVRRFQPQEPSYYLKTCLLYCTEAFNASNKNTDEGPFTPTDLYFWVERILLCQSVFYSQDFLPCYFMPSFALPISKYLKSNHMDKITRCNYCPLTLPDFYAYISSTNFMTDMPCSISQPLWEDFRREDFMKRLSRRVLK